MTTTQPPLKPGQHVLVEAMVLSTTSDGRARLQLADPRFPDAVTATLWAEGVIWRPMSDPAQPRAVTFDIGDRVLIAGLDGYHLIAGIGYQPEGHVLYIDAVPETLPAADSPDAAHVARLEAERDALSKQVGDLAHANAMRIGEWTNERMALCSILGLGKDATWRDLKSAAVILRDAANEALGALAAVDAYRADGKAPADAPEATLSPERGPVGETGDETGQPPTEPAEATTAARYAKLCREVAILADKTMTQARRTAEMAGSPSHVEDLANLARAMLALIPDVPPDAASQWVPADAPAGATVRGPLIPAGTWVEVQGTLTGPAAQPQPTDEWHVDLLTAAPIPPGLVVSEDGRLLNWRGQNYVPQPTDAPGRRDWAGEIVPVIVNYAVRLRAPGIDAKLLADRIVTALRLHELEDRLAAVRRWRDIYAADRNEARQELAEMAAVEDLRAEHKRARAELDALRAGVAALADDLAEGIAAAAARPGPTPRKALAALQALLDAAPPTTTPDGTGTATDGSEGGGQ